MNHRDYINRRLHPSRSMPEYYTLRHLLDKISEMVSVLERSGREFPLRVLDAGAGCAPYRQLFSPAHFQYVAIDREVIDGISALADGKNLPFSDGSFDLVLSNQVLEHVRDPKVVCGELARVVSDSGYLLLSCPFVWEIHNFPADYWRFSDQALRLLFADMDSVYLEPSTNTAQCLVQTFNLFLDRNMRSDFLKALLFRVTNSRLMLATIPKKDTLLPANYVLVGRRKTSVRRTSEKHPGFTEIENFRMHVDTPALAVPVRDAAIKISGWIAGDCQIDQVKARIDGSQEWVLNCNLPRVDVWRVYPQFRNAHQSGFEGECTTGGLSSGEHTLEIIWSVQGERRVGDPVRFRIAG